MQALAGKFISQTHYCLYQLGWSYRAELPTATEVLLRGCCTATCCPCPTHPALYDMEIQDASSSSAPAISMELTEEKGHTFFITCAFCFHLTVHLHNAVPLPHHHGSFHLPNHHDKRNSMRKSWYFPPSKPIKSASHQCKFVRVLCSFYPPLSGLWMWRFSMICAMTQLFVFNVHMFWL